MQTEQQVLYEAFGTFLNSILNQARNNMSNKYINTQKDITIIFDFMDECRSIFKEAGKESKE